MESVSIQAIIQARMGSTRLPGKIAMPFVGGFSFLGWIIERARLSARSKRVIVATSIDPKDDVTEEICARHGAACARGSEDDVLMRFVHTICLFHANIIARLTGDNPLFDVGEMDRMIEILEAEGLEYADNHSAGLPLGTGSEAFTSDAFAHVAAKAINSYDHEHVTPYFYRHPELFKQRGIAPKTIHPFASGARLTLDTEQDFHFMRALAKEMGFSNPSEQPPTAEILSFLETRPDLVAINTGIVQKTVPKA